MKVKNFRKVIRKLSEFGEGENPKLKPLPSLMEKLEE